MNGGSSLSYINLLAGAAEIFISWIVLLSYKGENMVGLTKITSKGQVVIPSEIRRELDLEEGTAVVVSRFRDFVLMKKVAVADPKEEFEALTKWGESFAKKQGIRSEGDVVARIQKGRGMKRA